MDEPNIPISPPQPPPNITLPLSLFLEVLWGYKKGAELRERAVPGPEIVALLAAVPNYSEYYHIQRNAEGLDTVWQKEFWRTEGQRGEELREKMDTLRSAADIAADKIAEKLFPVMTKSAIKQLAYDLIHNKQWVTLESMGVDTGKLKEQ